MQTVQDLQELQNAGQFGQKTVHTSAALVARCKQAST